jgi:hypothetical protein
MACSSSQKEEVTNDPRSTRPHSIMGGKIWTAEEEEVFWNQIVPQSYHRLGADRTAYPGRDWAALGREMRDAMGQYYHARDEEPPREYSGQALCKYYISFVPPISGRS